MTTARRTASIALGLALTLALSACAEPPTAAPAYTRPPPSAVVAPSALATTSSSAPVPSASVRAVAAPVAPHRVWPLLDGGLDVGPANAAWATGQPQVHITENGVNDVFQDVDLTKVPPSLVKLIGDRVVLYTPEPDPSAPRCTATITGLVLFTPSYWQVDTRSIVAHYNATPEAKRPSDPKIVAVARSVLKVTGGYRALVATVAIDPEASCSYGGTWAAPEPAPTPEVAKFEDAPTALVQKAGAALRGLPVFAAIQRAYAKSRKPTEPSDWWALPEYSEDYRVARLSDGRAIVVAAGRACRGYVDFTMNLEAFFTLTPADDLVPIEPAKPSEARWPMGVGDIDHDGELDVLTMDGYILSKGGKLEEQVFTRGPIYSCPGDGAAAGAFNHP